MFGMSFEIYSVIDDVFQPSDICIAMIFQLVTNLVPLVIVVRILY